MSTPAAAAVALTPPARTPVQSATQVEESTMHHAAPHALHACTSLHAPHVLHAPAAPHAAGRGAPWAAARTCTQLVDPALT